jgi:hypothetical protein
VISLTAAILVATAATAAANQWNEKTILKFSEPVMVPGATLQPGSYVFKLMDLAANRHTVRILTEDEAKQIAIATAVPMKRLDAKGDLVMKFNPTDAGSPPALKGYFYPGSLYGHEFIYPEEQARKIAERTKTIVLSIDVPGSDFEKGTVRTYDASGARRDWAGDAATMKEWEEWRKNRRATANVASAAPSGNDEQKQATAPMVKGDFQGMRIRLDQLEDNAQKYTGQTVSVDAEVEDIYGPRVFTIDEPNWGDLENEILVFMPTALAALVKEDDRITVTGTVKPFVRAEVEREWGWAGFDREIEVDLAKKPVLVASRIVGGNNNTAMVIEMGPKGAAKPVGTSGSAGNMGKTAITDAAAIARADEDLVGHEVNLSALTVASVAKDGGFFARAQNGTVFVLPSSQDTARVQAGDTVSVQGVVFELSQKMENRLGKAAEADGFNDSIYIYARSVTK